MNLTNVNQKFKEIQKSIIEKRYSNLFSIPDKRTEEEKELDKLMEEEVEKDLKKKYGIGIESLGPESAPETGIRVVKDKESFADRNNLGPGNYYIKDGKLVKGKPEQRQAALYSNWHGANSDPEDLERLQIYF